MRKVTAMGGGAARSAATPLLAVAAVLAPAAAHAAPVDDYVARKGKVVCGELDKAQSTGDIFRLSLKISHDTGFSLRDAASAVSQSAATYCPSNLALVRQAGSR
ncbi:hypothetical protein BN971_03525 [Mycobacterium bohemicum DSM 44277]|jgi:hypothetical protein|nr:DUF732 domain-containing protein [Mycobacterium bohemicum]MCV6971872.1 hypothetical protein [Mycobacterium bohemicum]CPR12231.1 hypothetical protein BN971_03525 [Mycobacterium bohemicum DSM 44277]